MQIHPIIVFQRVNSDTVQVQPILFVGTSEQEAVNKLKSHVYKDEWPIDDEIQCGVAFRLTTDFQSLKKWFDDWYAYYDVSYYPQEV